MAWTTRRLRLVRTTDLDGSKVARQEWSQVGTVVKSLTWCGESSARGGGESRGGGWSNLEIMGVGLPTETKQLLLVAIAAQSRLERLGRRVWICNCRIKMVSVA
jgi:hypothetical protein